MQQRRRRAGKEASARGGRRHGAFEARRVWRALSDSRASQRRSRVQQQQRVSGDLGVRARERESPIFRALYFSIQPVSRARALLLPLLFFPPRAALEARVRPPPVLFFAALSGSQFSPRILFFSLSLACVRFCVYVCVCVSASACVESECGDSPEPWPIEKKRRRALERGWEGRGKVFVLFSGRGVRTFPPEILLVFLPRRLLARIILFFLPALSLLLPLAAANTLRRRAARSFFRQRSVEGEWNVSAVFRVPLKGGFLRVAAAAAVWLREDKKNYFLLLCGARST